ncbi:hypothetical protein [Amycolatopsis benzoatilytica]|uniref:hypothetical protein n=1 Tax=Amycolatopsis benzoatilytica TaxID=346045 RepID=UPI00035CF84C|nr:hypothetical protein [Amycolatopsis benzoatilytica]
MVARDDREFLARVARINQALAASALPLINNTLDDHDLHGLGAELIAIGEEFLQRAHRALDTGQSTDVIDGEIVATTDTPHRTMS